MGLIRKAASISSLGAVNYRSKGERKVKALEAQTKSNIETQRAEVRAMQGQQGIANWQAQEQQRQWQLEQRRLAPMQPAPPQQSFEERLATLDRWLAQGLITPQLHAQRKAEILSEL